MPAVVEAEVRDVGGPERRAPVPLEVVQGAARRGAGGLPERIACLDQHGGDLPRGWSNVSCRRRTFRAWLARLTPHLRSGCRRSAWTPDRDANVRWPDVLPDGGRVVGLVHLHVVHLAGLVDGGGTRDLPHLALIIDDEITGSELTRKDAEPLPVGGRRR
jgi:hypothetical protein